ncbi:Glycosyl transferases group 1 [Selenomonas ruminantium]|uniref:Glycosyl transferases group 1 n=2 Tax=Selenomonas ruminantium TaxID=971 RepID=A0A1H0UEZ9_SELRU|nr:Glycosyl transferases group 1 [Selenomonas ruminantium]
MGIAYLFRVPCRIAHAHNSACEKTLKGYVKSILKKGFSTFATDLFACSNVAGKYMFGDEANYSIVNNSIELLTFSYSKEARNIIRNELGITKDTCVIGHIGRFEKQKNHELLIDIFLEINRHINSKLLLVGTGSLEKNIRKKVSAYGLESDVMFLGNRRDCARIYQGMDAFVMPSFFEGLPVTGVEAQVSGLQCFFSDSISSELKIGEASYFLPIKAPAEEWSNCIIKKILNKKDRYRLSMCASDARFDIEKQSERLERFYLRWA